jgi:hypothetical protein
VDGGDIELHAGRAVDRFYLPPRGLSTTSALRGDRRCGQQEPRSARRFCHGRMSVRHRSLPSAGGRPPGRRRCVARRRWMTGARPAVVRADGDQQVERQSRGFHGSRGLLHSADRSPRRSLASREQLGGTLGEMISPRVPPVVWPWCTDLDHPWSDPRDPRNPCDCRSTVTTIPYDHPARVARARLRCRPRPRSGPPRTTLVEPVPDLSQSPSRITRIAPCGVQNLPSLVELRKNCLRARGVR